MPDHDLHLNFMNPPIDNCFDETAYTSRWSDGVPRGNLRVVAKNTGTLKINVVVESIAFGKHETGWFNPGDTSELAIPLPAVAGAGSHPCQITRWRPGIASIPGNGGGEIQFGLPFEAKQASIELNVPK
jgi:hypothetical protein